MSRRGWDKEQEAQRLALELWQEAARDAAWGDAVTVKSVFGSVAELLDLGDRYMRIQPRRQTDATTCRTAARLLAVWASGKAEPPRWQVDSVGRLERHVSEVERAEKAAQGAYMARNPWASWRSSGPELQ